MKERGRVYRLDNLLGYEAHEMKRDKQSKKKKNSIKFLTFGTSSAGTLLFRRCNVPADTIFTSLLPQFSNAIRNISMIASNDSAKMNKKSRIGNAFNASHHINTLLTHNFFLCVNNNGNIIEESNIGRSKHVKITINTVNGIVQSNA